MSSNVSTYDVVINGLLLPQELFDIVDPPFKERYCPLKEESVSDYDDKNLRYYVSICKDDKIVLLHMAEEIEFMILAGIVDLVSPNCIALFFFAPSKRLNPNFNLSLAPRLETRYPTMQEVHFFDQGEIDYLKTRPNDTRNKTVSGALKLNKLITNGGPPPVTTVVAPLDLSHIQERVIELVIKRFDIAQMPSMDFFATLRLELTWPPTWVDWQPKAQAHVSARELVLYLVKQGSYPKGVLDGYKPLGDLLCRLIPRMGGVEAEEMFQMITKYQLLEANALSEYRQKLAQQI